MYINGEGWIGQWGETGQKMDFLLQTSLIKMLYAHYTIEILFQQNLKT